uniref:Small ribosomal subunit protein eS6 n=1 Tax=Sus scrofa TaxID=9823 RepID=A0A8D0X462_PIG
MKLSFSFPATGCQKFIGVDEERKLRTSYEKHMATEIAADALGEEWKGTSTCLGCEQKPTKQKKPHEIRKTPNLAVSYTTKYSLTIPSSNCTLRYVFN